MPFDDARQRALEHGSRRSSAVLSRASTYTLQSRRGTGLRTSMEASFEWRVGASRSSADISTSRARARRSSDDSVGIAFAILNLGDVGAGHIHACGKLSLGEIPHVTEVAHGSRYLDTLWQVLPVEREPACRGAGHQGWLFNLRGSSCSAGTETEGVRNCTSLQWLHRSTSRWCLGVVRLGVKNLCRIPGEPSWLP